MLEAHVALVLHRTRADASRKSQRHVGARCAPPDRADALETHGRGVGMSQRARVLYRSIAVWVVVTGLAGCAILPERSPEPAFVVRGPIPSRANAPVQLMFLSFRPRAATIQPESSLGFQVTSAYSSMFENGFSASSEVVLDGELWRNAVSARYGLSPDADLEIELPFLFATSGFLDRFVETFHALLLFPNSGRDERPDFAYEMEVHKEGEEIYRLEGDHLGLGDIPIVYTHRLAEETDSHPALALRLGLEFPSGSQSRGFGNGGVDFGGGVLAQRSWSRWTATGAIDYVVTRDPAAFERGGVEAEDVFDAQVGLEYRWNDELSLLTGLVLSSSVTHDIDIEELDSEVLMVDVGVAWDLDGSRLLVGFEEDAIAASGPDFTFFVAWSLGI